MCLVTKSKPHDIHQSASVLRNDGYTQFPGRQRVVFQGSRYSQSRRHLRLWMFSPCGFASRNVHLHCTALHFEKVWGGKWVITIDSRIRADECFLGRLFCLFCFIFFCSRGGALDSSTDIHTVTSKDLVLRCWYMVHLQCA